MVLPDSAEAPLKGGENMTYEEFESAAKEILDAHLDGNTSERIPDFLESVRDDYKSFETMGNSALEESVKKYEELKRKYVERFFNGEEIEKDEEFEEEDEVKQGDGEKSRRTETSVSDDKIRVEDIMG